MTPDFRVLADSVDITAKIRDRLVSLSVSDEAGIKSDTAEITLDDRDGALAVPAHGAELAVSMGYAAGGLVDMGLYRVDEVELAGGPERRMTIRAKSSDTRQRAALGRLKAPRSRSWHQTTLGALVSRIAADHGFTAVVGMALDAIAVGHIDQTEESDLHLLQRLARDEGAIVKPAGGRLLFVPRGEAKTAAGAAMPVIGLTARDLTSWTVVLAERADYRSVSARWHDDAAAELVAETVGAGEPAYAIRPTYPDAGAARRAAAAKLAAFQRGKAMLDLSLPGTPDIGAECRLRLSGIRPGVDGDWVVERAEHRFDGSGYATTVSAVVPK